MPRAITGQQLIDELLKLGPEALKRPARVWVPPGTRKPAAVDVVGVELQRKFVVVALEDED